jgi:hypothetical protein
MAGINNVAAMLTQNEDYAGSRAIDNKRNEEVGLTLAADGEVLLGGGVGEVKGAAAADDGENGNLDGSFGQWGYLTTLCLRWSAAGK